MNILLTDGKNNYHLSLDELKTEKNTQALKYKVSINDEEFITDMHQIQTGIYSIIYENQHFEVQIAQNKNGHIFYLHINGQYFNFEQKSEDHLTPDSSINQESHASGEITTPMPGSVVKYLVEKDQPVTVGQALVIVESMKMENEIKSPISGIVENIFFKPGEQVAFGKILLKISTLNEAEAPQATE